MHRRQIVELFDAWAVHRGERPVEASALAEPVRVLLDPQGGADNSWHLVSSSLRARVPVASS